MFDPTAAALDALAEAELRNRAALRRLRYVRTLIQAGWTLWADQAPTARLVEWRYLHRGEVHHGQPGNFENTEGVLWRPLPDTPSQADAPASTTKPDALMDALLAAVMDCGNLLSGIVAKKHDASKGAYQPGKAEHLRLLAMCEHALDLARAEGRT